MKRVILAALSIAGAIPVPGDTAVSSNLQSAFPSRSHAAQSPALPTKGGKGFLQSQICLKVIS